MSEGQFEKTVMEELCGIQDACSSLSPKYTPKISVVVCTKLHRQRFVVKSGKQLVNMEPGTVIDSGVVSPNYHNFFLCSQQAIQGIFGRAHFYCEILATFLKFKSYNNQLFLCVLSYLS